MAAVTTPSLRTTDAASPPMPPIPRIFILVPPSHVHHILQRLPFAEPLELLRGRTSWRRRSQSAVWSAQCGDSSTLSILYSGLSAGSGSTEVTSSPAPLIRPLSSARIMAGSSITGPRPTLMITPLGFMAANSASLIMLLVSAVSGAAATT